MVSTARGGDSARRVHTHHDIGKHHRSLDVAALFLLPYSGHLDGEGILVLHSVWSEDAAISILTVNVNDSVDGPVPVFELSSVKGPLDVKLGARDCFDVAGGLPRLILQLVARKLGGRLSVHMDLDLETG